MSKYLRQFSGQAILGSINPSFENPILLVEDDTDIPELVRYACGQTGLSLAVRSVGSHSAAEEHLTLCAYGGEEAHALPPLVILNVDADAVGCFSFVKWIRARSELNDIAILVFSATRDARYMHEAYEHGANAYVMRPTRHSDYVRLLSSIHGLWMKHKKLPFACVG